MRRQFNQDPTPDVNEVVGQVIEAVRRNVGKIGPLILVALLVAVVAAGTYIIEPGEQGVIRTFGKESGKTGPGLYFIIPLIQQLDVVNTEQIRRIEVGFRGEERKPNEALMLTGDENIVEAQMIVQYRVTDPSKYLFRLRDPEGALHATAEVALRSMVGRTNIVDVITSGREKVQQETRDWLQRLMDDYQSGLSITEVKLQTVDAPDEVKEAFHDVVRAREEKEKLINQAEGYRNDKVPRARGEAEKVTREAEAYRRSRVLRAEGDTARFKAMLAEYTKAQRVTRERMYLETMERILGKIDHKVVVDGDLAEGMLPILPLGSAVAGAAAAQGGKQP
jgi:membrane protease subunit HflK